MQTEPSAKKSILHVSPRDVLRPIRDQILTMAGYQVKSGRNDAEALELFRRGRFDLVLIDVDGEESVSAAERLCAEVKSEANHQLVAFSCNWRVALKTDCPDEVLRSEFDPAAFVAGVNSMLENPGPEGRA
jgi:DNA-binding response OmpR family regulator